MDIWAGCKDGRAERCIHDLVDEKKINGLE
jgi:hypothetical protein